MTGLLVHKLFFKVGNQGISERVNVNVVAFVASITDNPLVQETGGAWDLEG